MWNTIKDYATAAFYVLGGLTLVGLLGLTSLVLLIPVMFYGTYKILQIRRTLQQENQNGTHKINYTTFDHHRSKSHKD